jgi:hypothetical protein
MSSLYEKRPLAANENLIGIVLGGAEACADLVAIYNMVALRYSSDYYGQQGPVTEKSLKSIINDTLQERIRLKGISAAQARKS